jgi:hypothetical protein
MNTYTLDFSSKCPIDGQRIRYSLKLETNDVVRVELLKVTIAALDAELHESIADKLFSRFGGRQVIWATHNGVAIRTDRP